MFDFLFSGHPTPREGLLETALGCMEEGDFEAAREPLYQLLEMDPEDLEPYGYLGVIAFEEEDYDSAEAILRKGVEIAESVGSGENRPGVKNGWFDGRLRTYLKLSVALARICYLQQEFDEVKELARRVLELNPTDNLNVRALLGLVLHREGDLEEAVRVYRTAEGTPESTYNLGLALFEQGKSAEAAIAFREGFFMNCFIAPVILGEEPSRLFETELRNRSGAADARSFDLQSGDLWAGRSRAADFLGRIWNDPVVELEMEEYMRLVDELQGCERDEELRQDVFGRLSSLRSSERLAETNDRILDRVGAADRS